MKTINPIKNHGGILIRFSHRGKRYNFNPIPGGHFDHQRDYNRAKAIATQIAVDLELGNFDESLSKYRDSSSVLLTRSVTDLRILWERYTNYKTPLLSPTTLKVDFQRRVLNTLNKLPTTVIEESLLIRDWLLNNTSLEQTKKILTQINACCNWAKKNNLIEENPFQGLAAEIKVPKKDDEDINPFTASERDQILEVFSSHPRYGNYYPLVAFLFFTGCRPCEALPLLWEDVGTNSLTFNKSYVEGHSRGRLKTQKRRTIKLNDQVKELFTEIDKNNPLVFPSPTGVIIDWHNFSNRAWKSVLSQLPEITYRNPYQCRHTFITLALQKGVNVVDLAKFCGNSPKMILERYAGVTRDFVMPSL